MLSFRKIKASFYYILLTLKKRIVFLFSFVNPKSCSDEPEVKPKMVDVVIPMVFPDDPSWQAEYAHYYGDVAGALKHVRFRSWGTEELLVRCVMKYMPWVRCIHLLLSGEGQVQPWMRDLASLPQGIGSTDGVTGPVVKIVFHREFIPNEYLPCFSSPCIEMFLHRIPGLSEQFVYANDDMFPLSPLREEDFFRRAGSEGCSVCQVLTEKEYPISPNIFQRKCMNQQNMIGAPFGKRYTQTWLKNCHSFAPILKSSCEEVWRRHGNEILYYLSPLRRTEHSYNHYIYTLYQHFAGLSVEYTPREQYLGKGAQTDLLAEIIRDPQAGIVCLNDNETIKDWERRASIVRKEISKKLMMSDDL